ncbi:Uncharacterized conserved protein [Phaffia rhodozyma]|uniref:Uncharacterized conserved protein n=1 Tax=Phaffia rhodozyma TaxID=264483 RepID=A0A0F7SUZ1_PHARH|nr:Uncharacterized conserved protein [Phaffia rhodozyma]
MSASSAQLSASVTRILSLSNFPKELKTRDLIAAFSEWEGEPGGFKVKWVDDTNALIVFGEAATAKKAYLRTLLQPHSHLTAEAVVRPYDGPDAQNIISNVNARGSTAAPGTTGTGSRHGQGAGSISGRDSLAPATTSSHHRSPSFGIAPPIAGSHHRQSSFSHTRMGSFGSSTKSWGPNTTFSSSFSKPSGGRAHTTSSSSGSGSGSQEGDHTAVGGADAALGEIEKALKGVTTRGAQILGPGHMIGGQGQLV